MFRRRSLTPTMRMLVLTSMYHGAQSTNSSGRDYDRVITTKGRTEGKSTTLASATILNHLRGKPSKPIVIDEISDMPHGPLP